MGRLIPAGTGAGMNRLRVAATSATPPSASSSVRCRTRWWHRTRPPRSAPPSTPARRGAEGTGSDPLASVVQSGHGTDADSRRPNDRHRRPVRAFPVVQADAAQPHRDGADDAEHGAGGRAGEAQRRLLSAPRGRRGGVDPVRRHGHRAPGLAQPAAHTLLHDDARRTGRRDRGRACGRRQDGSAAVATSGTSASERDASRALRSTRPRASTARPAGRRADERGRNRRHGRRVRRAAADAKALGFDRSRYTARTAT